MNSDRPIETNGAPAHKPPRPTYAPFMLALGITMIFWGIDTSLIMSAGGLLIFIWAIGMWIREIALSWRN
jgi:hypothetical protein